MSVIVFLGPSLSWESAREWAPGIELRPPARQGDVFAALQSRPRVLCLIDGVFDSVPSVWHHELRCALDAGVVLFGASSMGALRAAEMLPFGMRPVGEVAQRYASGEWNDDDDVAVLHGPAEMGFRPLTVPHVCVVDVAERARKRRLVSASAAAELVALSKSIFWRERTWRGLLQQWSHSSPGFERLRRQPDIKARDALTCLTLARRLARQKPAVARATTMAAAPRAVLARQSLPAQVDAAAAATTLLLAQLARRHGFTPDPRDVAEERLHLRKVDPSTAHRWAEASALERLALQQLAVLSGGHISATEAQALAGALSAGEESSQSKP